MKEIYQREDLKISTLRQRSEKKKELIEKRIRLIRIKDVGTIHGKRLAEKVKEVVKENKSTERERSSYKEHTGGCLGTWRRRRT